MAQSKKTEAYTVPKGKVNRLREQARIESLRKDKIITNSEAEKLSDEIWEAGNKSLLRIITKLSFSEWVYIIKTFFEFLEEEKQNEIKNKNVEEIKSKSPKKSYWSGVGERIDFVGKLIDRLIIIVILVVIFVVFKSI
jgi:hypothetical protein